MTGIVLSKQQDTNLTTVRDMLKNQKAKFLAALPKIIPVDRFLGVVTGVLQRSPKLLECDVKTLFDVILQCAQIGLEPDNALGLAHIIAYNGKIKLIISYKGYIALAHRSGTVSDISARCIYENEKYVLEYGDTEILKHIPLPPEERGKKIIAAYAIVKMKNGGVHREFLYRSELMKLKDRASYKDIWNKYESEMCKKSAVRAASKFICLAGDDNSLLRATNIDTLGDVGLSQGILPDDPPEIIDVSADVSEKTLLKTDDLKSTIADNQDVKTDKKTVNKDAGKTPSYNKNLASYAEKVKIKELLIANGTPEEEFLFVVNDIIDPATHIVNFDHLTPIEAGKIVTHLESKPKQK